MTLTFKLFYTKCTNFQLNVQINNFVFNILKDIKNMNYLEKYKKINNKCFNFFVKFDKKEIHSESFNVERSALYPMRRDSLVFALFIVGCSDLSFGSIT